MFNDDPGKAERLVQRLRVDGLPGPAPGMTGSGLRHPRKTPHRDNLIQTLTDDEQGQVNPLK
ncbi:MAG: hypothetical protein ACK4L4_15200 [Gemmobacter sp.]